MHRRINVTLPEDTVTLIDRMVPKDDRSQLIAEAIKYYVEHVGRAKLRKRLKEGALRRAERDLGIADDWLFIDQEIWQRNTG